MRPLSQLANTHESSLHKPRFTSSAAILDTRYDLCSQRICLVYYTLPFLRRVASSLPVSKARTKSYGLLFLPPLLLLHKVADFALARAHAKLVHKVLTHGPASRLILPELRLQQRISRDDLSLSSSSGCYSPRGYRGSLPFFPGCVCQRVPLCNSRFESCCAAVCSTQKRVQACKLDTVKKSGARSQAVLYKCPMFDCLDHLRSLKLWVLRDVGNDTCRLGPRQPAWST